MQKKIYVLLCLLLLLIASCKPKKSEIAIRCSKAITVSLENIWREKINAVHKSKLLKQYFTKLFADEQFNGCVLVAQRGIVIYKDSFGYADLKTKEPLTLSHNFQLASVSKQFTAVAILKLAEMGKLNLSDSVQKFFPAFPFHGITVKQLLSHRSGLANYIYYFDKKCPNREKPLTNEEMLRTFINERPEPYYPPNARYDYSNTGYALLACIVEKASGMPFEVFMENLIFKPAGMKNTFVFNAAKNTQIPKKVKGYNNRNSEALSNLYLNGVVGDKGIYSSVEDLYHWDLALYSGKIVSDTSLRLAFTPTNPETKRRTYYGLGWRIYYLPDSTKVCYHGGWWQGFQTLLVHVEKEKTMFAVLKNIKNKSFPNQLHILSILFPEMKLEINEDESTE